MSSAEWITDRPPTKADGDGDGNVWMRLSPLTTTHFSVHWSYVSGRAPWRHAPGWQPSAEPAPAEPDRIAALEQRVVDRIADLEERTAGAINDRIAALEQRMAGRIAALEARKDAAGVGFPHLTSRLEKLEGVQSDGSAPRWTLDRIAALEKQVAELEVRLGRVPEAIATAFDLRSARR